MGKQIKLLTLMLLSGVLCSGGYLNAGNSLLPPGPGQPVMQQSVRTVSGKVSDYTGEIIGASVVVKGTTKGIMTDMDGAFTLEGVNEGDVIVVSYIGYSTQEIVYTGQAFLNIRLEEDTQKLDEVVVVGYGSVARKELTSAVTQISSKDFLAVGGTNPIGQIQGKVAGVSVSNTGKGDPNSGTSIQVRGVSSRNAGLGPLIVIDGVPGGNLENINENDIESITLLKDGAASAIYGTRGSNGVVLVTTKKGAADGRYRASYSGYVNIAVPQRELDVLSAEEFVDRNIGTDFGARTDWFDEISRTSVTHSHTIQFSGGNMRNNYRASVDYKNAEGTDLRSGREEFGARISLNHSSANGLLDLSANVAPRSIKYDNADWWGFPQALMLNPTQPVMDPDDPDMYFTVVGTEAYNPVEILNTELNGGERKFLDWDATAKLNLLPLLLPANTKHLLNTQITFAEQVNDNFTYFFQPSTLTTLRKSNITGDANRRYTKNKQQSIEWLVNYAFNHKDHNLRVMAGYSYQYFQNSSLYARNRNFASDLLTYNSLGTGAYDKVEGRSDMETYKNDSKLIGFFGRVNYDFRGKYLFTASLRREGSSKFGANHKWGYFPAVSAGWRISDENFMEGVKWVNDLKIRADYGVTGNQDFDSYRSLATMQGYDQIIYGGNSYTGWSANKNVNPDLRWEKGKNWNIGVDFSLFNNIFSGSINYYNRRQQDLLGDYNVPVPPNAIGSTYANVGTMKNTGIEIDLNIAAVRTKDFSYTIGLIGSTSDNRFVSFSNDLYVGQNFYWMENFPSPGTPGPVQQIREGERIGNFVTFEYAGVSESGDWLIYNQQGDVIPISEGTDDDKRIVGNGMPKFTASWNNMFRYKNFDLNLFFRGNFGYQVYNIHEFYYGLQAMTGQNLLRSAFGKNGHITTGINVHNSYFVQNADFLKLDVVTLGYTKKINSPWLESVRIYLTGRNLFTITGYDGVDPDMFPVNGLQPGVPAGKKSYYPTSRQFLIGLQLNF